MLFGLNLYSLFFGWGTGLLVALAYLFFSRSRLARAHRSARDIIDKSYETAEMQRRDAMVNLKNELDRERHEFNLSQTREKNLISHEKELLLERERVVRERETESHAARDRLVERENSITRRLDQMHADELALREKKQAIIKQLERAGNYTEREAREKLTENVREEVMLEQKQWIAKSEAEIQIRAKEKAGAILCGAMQRYLADSVATHGAATVALPSEEMKGKIIGKEGRNIRALEMATGMEFVITDDARSISISGFHPLRREIAKRTLEKLVHDGRINPTRIEETAQACEKEVHRIAQEMGEAALLEFGLTRVHPEMVTLLGRLHFRTSFSQNVLVHAREVAYFARMIAQELGLDGTLAARCGLFHDIGKAVSAEVDGTHALIGGDLAKEYGEDLQVVNAIAAHHEEVPAESLYAFVTQIADAVSAARPGARRETDAAYIKRIEQLEHVAQGFPGVKKAFALQAGREVRILVDECTLDDDKTYLLARDITKKIEQEMNFPGQIKVSVIREKRVIEYAK